MFGCIRTVRTSSAIYFIFTSQIFIALEHKSKTKRVCRMAAVPLHAFNYIEGTHYSSSSSRTQPQTTCVHEHIFDAVILDCNGGCRPNKKSHRVDKFQNGNVPRRKDPRTTCCPASKLLAFNQIARHTSIQSFSASTPRGAIILVFTESSILHKQIGPKR